MNHRRQATDEGESNLYRLLPSLHDLLLTPGLRRTAGDETSRLDDRRYALVLSRLKQEIAAGQHTQASLKRQLDFVHVTVADQIALASRYTLRRVINATGVVLHTNLGRAP